MRSDEIRKRLEVSALGSGTTEKARVAPTQEEVNMFMRFLKIFGVTGGTDPIKESRDNQATLTGDGSSTSMARLFRDKDSRAN